ncbi:unnamed protein product [Symbiodinium necroappetens]|uniref:Exostosin GT47 domain-containing protein n=1 Tax=Symbiodinium necroappetens TaxID=1628268 RepID=A0A812VWY6_9DINO|nr:unnamed protein product [Symbiodinium necroappetens]
MQNASRDNTADDLVEQVATDMMREGWLLCFDEFQVTHISDAIIMKRIFSVLFELGAVVVATSNRPPQDLYLNGLNRPLFLPFIPMLENFCKVHDIGAEVDYRMTSTRDGDDDRVYITPNGPAEQKILENKFSKICQGKFRAGAQVEAQGRKLLVPRCAEMSDVAWFDFSDLCNKALGAADYLAIGRAFHTVFLANIPRLTMQERDQVRRFITLIDSLYECHTKVVCTAELDPIPLFYVSEEERNTSTADEIFAWHRTAKKAPVDASVREALRALRAASLSEFFGLINAGNWSFNDQQVFLLRKQILRAYRELEARSLREDPEASPPPFKVYVYDEEQVPQLKPLLQSQIYCSRGQWGTDVQLHDFFVTSNIQTDDPAEADFFFVPGYAICVLEGNLYSLDEVDELYKELVVALPYFNASGGRDHIFVFGSGMAQTFCKTVETCEFGTG